MMSDWSEFTKRINVDAPLENIYRAFTTPRGFESWFLRTCDFQIPGGGRRDADEAVERGDSYLWRWYGWTDDVTGKGEILEVNGRNFIMFSFHHPMTVSVMIVEERQTRIVELRQQNIPPDENSRTNYFVGCGEGWTFYLTNLKSVLEGGLDLRNKDAQIKNVINA